MLFWVVLAGLFLIPALAVKAYNFFEGETFWRDLGDELNLSLKSLAALDRQWAANPNRSDAVVSLTTIPSRLPHIAPTLKSLLRQSRAPSRIILNLPRHSRRENCAYVVPDEIARLAAVEIRPCEDLGPATKAIPTLLAEAPDRLIIVVDDDRIYPATLLADLESYASLNPHAAFGMSGWKVPADLTDKPTTVFSNIRMQAPAPIRARRLKKAMRVDILQGMSGYALRPRFFDLEALADYRNAPPQAFFVDDVWIAAHTGVPRFIIPARRSNYQAKLRKGFYRATSLGLINRGPGGNAQRNNSVLMRHFADRWRGAE